jgi:hypothetical protein
VEKVYNEELHSLYSSPNLFKMMKCAGHVAHMGEVRNEYKLLVGKPEGKRPLRRPRHRWKDNIKMDLREIGFGCGLDSYVSG